LQTERVLTSAGYAGSGQKVVDLAASYAKERKQFGRAIGEFQAISHMLADMQTEVDAARLLVYRAAGRLSHGLDALREVSMAKLFGSETYAKVSQQGMQIMGAYGYSMEYEMQRHFRDARSTTIGAGSSQMQRNAIASTMGLAQK
jgi:alkylation response protein AidB-like acyl-CoA dehydrogenase